MNLYEWEGKQLFEKHGIAVPRGVLIRRGDDVQHALSAIDVEKCVAKAQILSGKRGKSGGIRFLDSVLDIEAVVDDVFGQTLKGQYVASVRVEEKLDIEEEHYLSITYDTAAKQPVLVYSTQGGMDIEDVPEEQIEKHLLDIRREKMLPLLEGDRGGTSAQDEYPSQPPLQGEGLVDVAQKLWNVFFKEDARLAEINPLVKTTDGKWVAADAKVALDDDAFYRHDDWQFEPRTMMGRLPTEREVAVQDIDRGKKYYQGTAGKYIEMDGDIAILFSGGGASIANMDALINAGLQPANYTEYSGNPPREKVAELAKIVLSKPGLQGLWIAGGVANFTNVKETFLGIIDALDEIKPQYPIVVRRAGPFEAEGMQLMRECAERNNLNMKLFGKTKSMSDTSTILTESVE